MGASASIPPDPDREISGRVEFRASSQVTFRGKPPHAVRSHRCTAVRAALPEELLPLGAMFAGGGASGESSLPRPGVAVDGRSVGVWHGWLASHNGSWLVDTLHDATFPGLLPHARTRRVSRANSTGAAAADACRRAVPGTPRLQCCSAPARRGHFTQPPSTLTIAMST